MAGQGILILLMVTDILPWFLGWALSGVLSGVGHVAYAIVAALGCCGVYAVSLVRWAADLMPLVQHAKIDIQDIFVSQITEQYLESMAGVDELDMDSASESSPCRWKSNPARFCPRRLSRRKKARNPPNRPSSANSPNTRRSRSFAGYAQARGRSARPHLQTAGGISPAAAARGTHGAHAGGASARFCACSPARGRRERRRSAASAAKNSPVQTAVMHLSRLRRGPVRFSELFSARPERVRISVLGLPELCKNPGARRAGRYVWRNQYHRRYSRQRRLKRGEEKAKKRGNRVQFFHSSPRWHTMLSRQRRTAQFQGGISVSSSSAVPPSTRRACAPQASTRW